MGRMMMTIHGKGDIPPSVQDQEVQAEIKPDEEKPKQKKKKDAEVKEIDPEVR